MTPPERISRRGTLAAIAALWFGHSAWRLAAAPAIDDMAQGHRALLALFADRTGAAAIGQAYLSSLPVADASVERLVAAIVSGAAPPTAPELKQMVHRRMRRDFADGNIVRIDGWMLSVTEARLYALAALA